MFEAVKALCDSFLKMGVPGFDLCVYKDGKCKLRYMGGYSDIENKIPVCGNESYNIYSASKPITCTAAMQLWERGLFSLDDKLSDYMPEFSEMTVKTAVGIKKAEKPILIKNLFEMTAGFSYDCRSLQLEKAIAETGGRCPTRETVKYLAKEPLLFEPGERWEYSLCHDVLAALVEVISGEEFNSYVTKNIFEPLGMKNSTYILPKSERRLLAGQYRFDDSTSTVVNIGRGNDWYVLGDEYASGGAGCVSTVDDYIKFLEALRTGDKILKKETVTLMSTDRLSDSQRETYWTRDTHGYGLGVRCRCKNGRLSDFGWGGAAGAHLAVDRENGISVFYAQHMLNSPNQSIRDKVYELALHELKGNVAEAERILAECEIDRAYKYTF